MARKVKKETKKHASFNKEADADHATKSWPDLPQKLINVISWQYDLMQDISYGGVTKSWRIQPRNCNHSHALTPWLELYDGSDDRKYEFSITFHQGEWLWYSRRPWPYPWKYYVGYSDVAFVAKGASPTEYYLHYCDKSSSWTRYCRLPPWDPNIPFQRAVISSLPTDRWSNSLLVLTGISHPAFVFRRLNGSSLQGEYEWIKQDCTITDPHFSNKSEGQHFMRFTNAIGHEGKFYALSLQGTLAVIEVSDVDYLRITALGPKRAVPSVSSKYFRECLLESDGEILLVFLISRKSLKFVEEVEIFQLDIASLSWIKRERLGDRTLFLGSNCSMSVSASKLRCKRDCVYFSHQEDTVEGWWVYDVQRGNISPCRSDEILPQNFSVTIERTRRLIKSINLRMQE